MTQDEILAQLPEQHRKHLDPASPAPMRMMASKGLAPLPPRELVLVLCGLSLDANEKLAQSARTTLGGLPDKILLPALEAQLGGAALHVLATASVGRDAVLEKLVLNRDTPDDAVAVVALDASAGIAEIIVANQERCLRSEALVRAIRENPNVLHSSLARLFDFLVRSGVIYDDLPEVREAIARLSPAEMVQMADAVQLPDSVGSLLEESDEDDAKANVAAKELDRISGPAEERVPMLKLVGSLNVAQKISLALKGNKEARTILLRDANRMVAAAAVRSPRLTEPEIAAAAKSRSVSDEVVRIIASSKDMTRTYNVKLALVGNPKTPLAQAMRFLTLLRAHDVRTIAKSKNVPSAVAKQAKRLVEKKR